MNEVMINFLLLSKWLTFTLLKSEGKCGKLTVLVTTNFFLIGSIAFKGRKNKILIWRQRRHSFILTIWWEKFVVMVVIQLIIMIVHCIHITMQQVISHLPFFTNAGGAFDGTPSSLSLLLSSEEELVIVTSMEQDINVEKQHESASVSAPSFFVLQSTYVSWKESCLCTSKKSHFMVNKLFGWPKLYIPRCLNYAIYGRILCGHISVRAYCYLPTVPPHIRTVYQTPVQVESHILVSCLHLSLQSYVNPGTGRVT